MSQIKLYNLDVNQDVTAYFDEELADFNGDGNLDMIRTNPDVVSTCDLFLGDGQGHLVFDKTFTVPIPYAIAARVGHLDANRSPDLVFSTFGERFVPDYACVMLNDGQGNFTAAPGAGIGTAGLKGMLVGDFSGVGRDQVLLSYDDSVQLFSSEDGLLTPVAPPFATFAPALILQADFNHDGRLDLMTSSASGPDFFDIYLNTGGPEVFPSTPSVTMQLPGSNGIMAAGDFNADGIPDLVWGPTQGGTFYSFGNGDGTFQAPVTVVEGTGVAYSIVVGDLNLDGVDDFAVAFRLNGLYGIYSVLSAPDPLLIYNPLAFRYSLRIGDFNNDGAPDLQFYQGFGSTNLFVNRSQKIDLSSVLTEYHTGVVTLPRNSTAGLAIHYAVESGPATVEGNVITFDHGGEVVLKATQTGSDLYNEAAPVTKTFTIIGPPRTPSTPVVYPAYTSATGTAANGSVVLTVFRTIAEGPLTVNYQTINGTALAGTDYTAASGTLTFEDGVDARDITIPLLPDAVNGRQFQVELSAVSGAGAVLSSNHTTTVTIAGPLPYAGLMTAAYAQAKAAFAAGDQATGYFSYAAYSYYLYFQQAQANPPADRRNLNSYYQCMAYAYYICYVQAGDTAAALAWYNYYVSFIA